MVDGDTIQRQGKALLLIYRARTDGDIYESTQHLEIIALSRAGHPEVLARAQQWNHEDCITTLHK
jgi:hypothetical protein